MNHAVIQGAVCTPPRLRQGERSASCSFDLEVPAFKEGEEPYMVPVVLWGQQAEWMAGRDVGDELVVIGRIEVRSGRDGGPRTISIQSGHVEHMGPAPSDEEVPF